jgi:hypothetical protein
VSDRQTFFLVNPRVRQNAVEAVRRAPEGFVVRVQPKTRSLEQNAALWAKLGDVSEQVVWYGQKLSANDWKDMFTASLRRARVVPGIDAGTYVPLGMRTSTMTVSEMSDLLELISAFGAEHNVVFHDSEEVAA